MDKKIIFISSSQNLFQELILAVENSGYTADHFLYEEVDTAQFPWEEYRICIIEHDTDLKTFSVCDMALSANNSLKIIFITHISPIDVVEQRIIHTYPDNIISHSIPFIHSKVLSTIHKLFTDNIFGFSFYISDPDQEIHSFTINDSKKKKEYITRVLDFGMQNDIRSRILGSVASVLDEMIMNAIYNAPADENGNFIYANVDRRERVLLTPEQSATMSFYVDEHTIGLSMCDPFGSLKRDKVLYYLYKCKRKGPDQIDVAKSGAGLGIYKTFMNVNDFIINIKTGVQTECIVFIPIGDMFHKRDTQSFNIFLQE